MHDIARTLERSLERSLVPPRHRRTALYVALLGALAGGACRSKVGEDGAAGGAAASPGEPAASPAAAATSPPASTQPTTGRTIDVQMVGDATGYRFVPATVTIKVGDTVRWINASGGPHNVTFWPDSVPAGAAGGLQAGMAQSTAPLTGPLLTAPNATYAVSFAAAPAGTYGYYCMPHLALGMKGKVVVER